MEISGWTNYFERKWKEKYKIDPKLHILNDIINNDSLQVQSYAVYYNGKKKSLESILAVFWSPKNNLVFKIDPTSKSIVTFYCQEDLKNLDQEKLDMDKEEERKLYAKNADLS